MKKTLIVLLIVLFTLGSLFAEEAPKASFSADPTKDVAYSEALKGFKPSNPEYMGMGGAGLAINKGLDALFLNPAILGQGVVRVSVPSVTFTLNHVYDYMESGIIDEVQNLQNENGETDLSSVLPLVSNVLGSSKGKLVSVDASAGIIANVLGFGVNINDTIRTYKSGLFNDLKISSAVGFGLGFGKEDFRVNFGIVGKYNINIFSQLITVSDIQSIASSSGEGSNLLDNVPLAVGTAIPFDIGVTLRYKFLKFTTVVSDISFGSLGEYKYSVISATDATSDPTGVIKVETEDFTFKPKTTLNFGLGLEFGKSTAFRLAYDFLDVLSVKSDMDAGNSFKGVFLNHSKLGVEASLFNFLKVRGGLNSGYWTVGGTVNIGIITLDCAYYWEELGLSAGQNGLDGLSIRFNLGWDS